MNHIVNFFSRFAHYIAFFASLVPLLRFVWRPILDVLLAELTLTHVLG